MPYSFPDLLPMKIVFNYDPHLMEYLSSTLIGTMQIGDQLYYTITYEFYGNNVTNTIQSSQLP